MRFFILELEFGRGCRNLGSIDTLLLLPGALFLDPFDAPVWELAMRGITNRHDDSRPDLSTGDLEV